MIGTPHVHLRRTGSTNDVARGLAMAGAPAGTLVTAAEQSAGRGRQGRTWSAPPGRALLLSLIVRRLDPLLSLRAGLAVARLAGEAARVKWPNDVLVEGRKVAGVLVEGRPQEGWAVIGIGVNVAVAPEDFPEELRATAGTLGRAPEELPAALTHLLAALDAALEAPAEAALADLRRLDALVDRPVRWRDGEGAGAGIAADGSLLVRTPGGEVLALGAGEVHLGRGHRRPEPHDERRRGGDGPDDEQR